MRSSPLAALAILLTTVAAAGAPAISTISLVHEGQSTSTSTSETSKSVESSTSTSGAAVSTHTVAVGADGYNFSPDQLDASVGDLIEFFFYPQNHSVARAVYGQPCVPYEYSSPGAVGFWSGFQPVQLVLSDPPRFQVVINDTSPVFFYCSAPGACFDGMVGVINPNSTQTYQVQFELSQNATIEFSPGENYFPVESQSSITRTTIATGATMTPTPAGTAITSSGTASSFNSTSSHKPLSGGAIAGIAIGGVVVALGFAALLYMCGRHRKMREHLWRAQASGSATSTAYQPHTPDIAEAQYANMQKRSGSRYGAAEMMAQTSSPTSDRKMGMTGSPPMSSGGYARGFGMDGASPSYERHLAESELAARYNRPPPALPGQMPAELASTEISPSRHAPRPYSFEPSYL